MSVVSGSLAASAQRKGNKQNRKSAKETNAMNLKMFRESRGSKGSAILPIYAKKFEKELYNETRAGFKDTKQDFTAYRDAGARFRPMQDSANTAAEGIFNDALTGKLIENARPVHEARVGTSRQSSLDALGKTISEITANQARSGFVGNSSGNQALRARANAEQAGSVAAQNLRNLEEIREIRDRGEAMKLDSLSLPGQMVSANADYLSAAGNGYIDALTRRLGLSNSLRIGTGAFQNQMLPESNPGMGIGGAIASGAGQIASAYLNYKNGADTAAALSKIGATQAATTAATNAATTSALTSNAAALSATPSYLSAARVGL